MESCWLNSCMQLVLATLDHSSTPHENESSLMKLFLEFQSSDQTKPLNPLIVRDELLKAEVSRINNGNIQPQDRYFQFEGSQTNSLRELKKLSELKQEILDNRTAKTFFCVLKQTNITGLTFMKCSSFSYNATQSVQIVEMKIFLICLTSNFFSLLIPLMTMFQLQSLSNRNLMSLKDMKDGKMNQDVVEYQHV